MLVLRAHASEKGLWDSVDFGLYLLMHAVPGMGHYLIVHNPHPISYIAFSDGSDIGGHSLTPATIQATLQSSTQCSPTTALK